MTLVLLATARFLVFLTDSRFGRPFFPRTFTHEFLGNVGLQRNSLQHRFEAMHSKIVVENQTLESIQRAQIKNHFNRRREQDQRRLATLRERGRSLKVIKLIESHIQRDEELAGQRQRDLDRKAKIGFNFHEVAAGIFLLESIGG